MKLLLLVLGTPSGTSQRVSPSGTASGTVQSNMYAYCFWREFEFSIYCNIYRIPNLVASRLPADSLVGVGCGDD